MTPQDITHQLIELNNEQNYLNGILDALEGTFDIIHGQLDRVGAVWSGNIYSGDFCLDLVEDGYMMEATLIMNLAQKVRTDIVKYREMSNDNKKKIKALGRERTAIAKSPRFRRLG